MNITTLDKLPINTLGKVRNINFEEENSDGIKRRLLDLGIINETTVKSILKSPLGDPTAYEVRRCGNCTKAM